MKQDIYIEGFIGEVYDIFGDTKSFTLSRLTEILNSLPADTTELDVHINSGGGIITEGFAIYDKLVDSPYIVNTIVEGMAGSIATVIAQAGKKGSRKMMQNAEYFIHLPSWQPTSPDNYEASDLQKLADELKREENRIADFYTGITGKSKSSIMKRMEEATTLSAKEAKSLGFIDEIINTSLTAFTRYRLVALTEKPKQKQMDNTEIKGMFTNINTTLEKLTKFFNTTKTAYIVTLPDGTTAFSDVETPTKESKLYKDSAMTVEIPNTLVEAAPIVNEDVEKLKAELEAKNAEIEALKAAQGEAAKEVEAAKQATAEVKQEVEAVTAEFTNLKNKLITGGFQNFVTEGVTKIEPTKFNALDEAAKKISERLKK